MKAVRLLISMLAMCALALQASAAAPVEEVPDFSVYDLTDVLSPEELLYEFGIDDRMLFKSMMWQAGSYSARLHIIINKANKGQAPGAQTLEAYLDGQLIHTFKISTGAETPTITTSGKPSGRQTPVGTYKIYHRNIMHISKTWKGAKMEHAQFFNGGIALHATTPDHYHELGRRASGGCVRLHPTNSKIMWDLVGQVGVNNTLVTVYDGSVTQHPMGNMSRGDQYFDETAPAQQPAPQFDELEEITRQQEQAQREQDEIFRKQQEEQRKQEEAARAEAQRKQAERQRDSHAQQQSEYRRQYEEWERQMKEYERVHGKRRR